MYYHYEESDYLEMGPEDYCFEAKDDNEAMKHVRKGMEKVKLEEITKPKIAKYGDRFFFDYKIKRTLYSTYSR